MQEEVKKPEFYWEQWRRDPGPKTMSMAVKSLDNEISNFANSYSSSIDHGVARGKAKAYAIDAIKTYDPKMGATLKTHFFNYIKPLARETKALTESVSLSKHYERNSNQYVNFVNSFVGDYGREPDDSEIMDGLGITPKQLKVLNSVVKYEMPEAQMENFDFEDAQDEYSQKLNMWSEFVYNDLSPRGKKIMDMKMGRNGHTPMTSIEIAQRLGISPKEVATYSEKIARSILDGVNIRTKKDVENV
jgi:DNA-directed RNA polymerase specialized sigma subunit